MSTIVTRAGKGSALTWTEGDANITNLNNDKIENVVEDLTPQLGGDLDVNGKKIVSTSNGNIALEPNGTGKVTANKNIETTADVKGFELWSTSSNGDEGGQINLSIPATNTSLTGQVTIDVYQNKLRIFQGNSARGAYIDLTAASAGVGSNLLGGSSFDPASPGAIGGTTAAAGTFTDLTSTGKLTFKQPIEAIYDLGTTGGTIAPNCSNGSVQKITLNSALTINAFTSPVAGQSLTLIIYGGTSYTSITSTMKFAGGVKTLTGTAGCIDILSVYYDGTNYFASLGKGFA